MKPRVFIDGEHGTTGLQIRERMAERDDIEVLSLPHEARRDKDQRRQMLNQCDIAILCLPDEAAREAVMALEEAGNTSTRVIDTSTAHRSHPDWVYGFAEIDKDQPTRIRDAQRVSNPGCYSTGAIALLKPLIDAGLMPADLPVTINAVSGYSGGGKQLIAQMEDTSRDDHIDTAYHLYALGLEHKHVPEIIARSGLEKRPVFTAAVGRFAQGMLVSIPLHLDGLNGNPSADDIRAGLEAHYTGQKYVTVVGRDEAAATQHIRPQDSADTDSMKLYVLGAPGTGHVNLVAQLDNLGKGASGAAVQNLNLMLGSMR